MKKSISILLLIVCLFAFSACGQKDIANDEPTDDLEQLLTDSDIDLSSLSDEELEIFISLVHEQGSIEHLTSAEDGAITWQSGEISNRLSGEWESSWSPLPDPHGHIVYQSLDSENYSALLSNYSLADLKNYIQNLLVLGFSQNVSSSEESAELFTWHGESTNGAVNLTLQNEMLWIEYFINQ